MTFDIAGARVRIEDPEATLAKARAWGASGEADVLLADARSVFGRDHLSSAAIHAERSQARGTMVVRSIAIEALLYLSGQRQVADAIRVAGIRKGTKKVAIAVFGGPRASEFLENVGWSRDDSGLEPRRKSLRSLGITAAEETTVPDVLRADLALERVALVDVKKG